MRQKINFSPLRYGRQPLLWSLVLLASGLSLTAASSAMAAPQLGARAALLLGAGGATLSLLLALGLWLLLAGRARTAAAARAVRRELDRLATVIRRSSLLVVTTDADVNITWVNAAFSRATGLAPDAAVGKNLASLFNRSGDAQPRERLRTALAQRSSLRLQYLHQPLTGEPLWLDLDLQAEHDAMGDFSGFVAIASDITEQRAAADKLTKAVRDNQALMEALDQHSIVSIADPAGSITYANDMFSRISGYRSEELLGQNHRTIKSDAQPDEFWAAMWQTITNGYVWRDVVCNRAKNGSLYWVDTVIAPFFNADGAIEKYVSIRTDVSAARAAQQALAVEREHLSHIIMDTHVGTWEWNVQSGEIILNERCADILGYTLQELAPVTQQTWSERCHPDDLRQANQLLAQHLEGGSGYYDCEIRMRHRHGHWVWVHSRGKTSAWTKHGQPQSVSGTHMDISQQKHAAAEIARTTTILQSVLDSASEVAVITSGLDRTITLFNKGAERMLGYAADEVVGRHTSALFFDPEEVVARGAALAVELGRPVAGLAVVTDESALGKKAQWTHIRKDGSRIVVAQVVTPLSDASGARIGYLAISHDISTEKDYENGLRAAMEEAEAATVAKSQFLANMSHEIRTPMNAILGMLKLLHNTELSERQLDYTSKTEGAAQSLLGLLNNILDFSKVDAGKMTLDAQPFQLDRLLRDLSVILSANVGEKPVEVLFDVDPAVPEVLIGDSMRLQQVLTNLSGNAIKFTEQGNVLVQIKVLARAGADTTLRFSVRDSGIGISPENQQHIFDGFSQAEASTTRRYGGTGLGLSICKRLVALMGGELALDSALGQGSTFYFSLTLPAPAAAPDDLNRPGARLPAALRVLVVDDNAVAREVLVAMALSLGWQADVAQGGAQALRLIEARASARQEPYQAVFVDWQMPGMDGWETSLRIRQITPAEQAPIIVMVTAHGREMLLQRSGQEHACLNGFLVKPVTASMLFDAVADARAGHRNLRASPRSAAARPRPLQGLRLLLVEDNLINQQVAQELLSAEGALVELAANGQLGVAAVAAARPLFDAVLMDIQMPVMDGYTATRAIRHQLGLTALPVIAMTANATPSDRAACLAAGMNDHVGKPFDLEHLIKVLQSHTGRARDAAAAPAVAERRAAADGVAAPPPPPGTDATDPVDVAGALARLGGKTDLYVRILRSYLGEIASLPDQLDGLLQRGELAPAARLLHTLKGLSATVGASHLADLAASAENAVRNGAASAQHEVLRAGLRAAVASTGRSMEQVVQQLGTPAAPAPQPRISADPAPDAPALLAQLRELHALLKRSDMRAIEHHARLRQRLATLAPDEPAALDAAMAVLDFARGVVQCEALIQKLGSAP